jgi:thiamine-phosphate pyrophosphorylase
VIEPGLYVIIHLDWHLRDRRPPADFLRKVLAGGCSAVQLRFKTVPDEAVLKAARRLGRMAADAGVPFIVNDRPDIALLVGADGVHVGQQDLPPARIAAAFPALAIGLSTHTLRQVRAVDRGRVSYIGYGPVFVTSSKRTGYRERGLMRLRSAARAARVPVVAIGGIRERDCAGLVKAGVRRAAVLSALYTAPDPRDAARAIHGALLMD